MRTALGALGLVVAVAIVYWPTLQNGFVSDDFEGIINNPPLRSLQGLGSIWFEPGATVQYYPLTFTTFWIEYSLWGTDPLGYHIVNGLLHAATAVLLWRVLVQLEVPGAWLGAAIFAVHPVHVQTVAWVSERKNVLSCLLALSALLAYLRFAPMNGSGSTGTELPRNRGSWRYYALALALYLAAVMAKSVTASLPAVVLVIDYWKRGRLRWRDAALLVPFFVVGLAMSFLTAWVETTYAGAQGHDWALSLTERLLIAGRAPWFYAQKLIWPSPLIFFYPRWIIDASNGWQYLFLAGTAALLAGLWLARGRLGRGPLAAALIFGGVLVPALGFFDIYYFKFSFVADHWQYHASIALIALGTAVIALLARRLATRVRVLAPLAATSLLVALAFLANQKTYAYKSELTLHEDIREFDPSSWVAANNLGAWYLEHGEYTEAIVYLRDATRLRPEEQGVHRNLGLALSESSHFEEAMAEFARALACESTRVHQARDRAMILKFMAAAQSQQRQFQDALLNLNQAIQLVPDMAEAYVDRARILGLTGDNPAALLNVEHALKLQPDFPDALFLRASLLGKSGHYKRALADLKVLRQIDPKNRNALVQTAAVHLTAGQFSEALSAYDQLLNTDPEDGVALHGRGDALLGLGLQGQAVGDYEAALKIDPQNDEIRNNLAWLLATSTDDKLRNGARAVKLARAACEQTKFIRADYLSTLAAAYAETGDFQSAISFVNAATERGDSKLIDHLSEELVCFRAHRPMRVPPPTTDPARPSGRAATTAGGK